MQLLTQESGRKTFLASFSPSVAAVDNDSAAPVKGREESRHFGSPAET